MAGQAFGNAGGDDEIFAGINVTPLVDVVLVLLIIFMITAPAIYQQAIQVQLPQAASGEEAPKGPIQITVGRDGTISWNGERLDWAAFDGRVKAIGAEAAATETAVISADEATPHGTVVKLMDGLRGGGLTRFAIQVTSAAAKK